MLRKLTTIRSVDQLLELIDTVSNNLDTNLTTNEILSFYNIFKNIISVSNEQTGDVLRIDQIRLTGDGEMIYFKNLKLTLWSYILRKDSIKDASSQMKINLELENPDFIKKFTFKP